MRFIRNLLINIISKVRDIFSVKDYTIVEKSIEYKINQNKNFEIDDDYWEKEYDNWEEGVDWYFDDSGKYRGTKVPENVEKIIIRIKYWCNNRIYKYITNDINHPWPPKEPEGIVVHIPLTSARLMDHDDKPIKDLMNKIEKYGGPRKDFHGEKVKIADVLYYTEDDIPPRIKITNILGMTKIVDTKNGFFNDLRIP